MKKIYFVLLLIAALQVCGQTYDTVYNRSDELYYSEWYDTALIFLDTFKPCCLYSNTVYGYTDIRYQAFSDYTSRPLQVRGLALMHTIDYNLQCMDHNNVRYTDTSRVPEYVALYQGVGDSLLWLTTVRWDTATPQVLKLPKKQDTTRGFEYCYLYRVYFDTPITVDSVFYIAGSIFNNIFPYGMFQHRPTYYVSIGRQPALTDVYYTWPHNHQTGFWASDDKGPWHRSQSYFTYYYGPFFAIAPDTSCVLDVRTADSAMGSVQGGGWYLDSSYITITAVPESGYRFTHWNDGDVTNPRTILLMHDTSFTAYFRATEVYELALESNDAARGSVYGAGRYEEGDTATISARAWGMYRFAHWNDGDTANPRKVVMTQDTAFVGIFVSQEGVAEPTEVVPRIVPNPADGYVVVSCEGATEGVLVITDASGKEVRRHRMQGTSIRIATAELPTGVYYVTLTTPQGTGTQKLVVERN